MQDFYLAGEPETNSSANLVVRFKFNPEIISAWNARKEDPTYDNIYRKSVEQYSSDREFIHITFNQL